MKLPLKIVVFNNSVLGFVAMEMKAGGYLTDGTELHDTNFARIAEACGITGIRVEKASEVDDALQRAFAIDGPVLVDVVVAKEELAIRLKSSWNRPKVLASTCCAPSSAGAVTK